MIQTQGSQIIWASDIPLQDARFYHGGHMLLDFLVPRLDSLFTIASFRGKLYAKIRGLWFLKFGSIEEQRGKSFSKRKYIKPKVVPVVPFFPKTPPPTTRKTSQNLAFVSTFISLAKAICSSGRMALRSVIILIATTCRRKWLETNKELKTSQVLKSLAR